MGRMQKLMPEFVQMVYVVDQNRPEMRSVRCFQLVKEYVKEDAEEMLDIQNKTMSLTISPVIQVYQTILATADRGITTSEILAVMPFLGIKVLNIMLAQLLGEGRDGKKTAGLKYVSVVGENAGTSRINRYYAIESPVSEIQRQDMKIIGFELPEFIDDFVEPLRNIPNQTPLRLQSALNSNVSSNITPAPTPQDSPRITDLELEDLLNCKHCKVALDVNFTDQDFTMEFCSKKCQDIYNTTDSNANSKSPAKKNRKTATGLQRRQYLKDLLEINQFMDMTGRNIAKKIREYGLFRNDKTIGKHQIDSKTIERLVDSMKAANELKVVNVSFENFGGRSIMKKIICWPTANTDGPNFKAFVQSMKEESMLAKGATPARKVIEVADTIKRLAPPSLMPKAKLGDGYEGNVIAENYGYIFPKNQKMVALHKWLYDATVPDWATPIKERYIWKMMECTAKMPLAVYLQCFGVRFKCPPLDRLLSDPEFNSSTSIKDLPLDVKTAIINLNSFKDSFFTLISMLEVLELIVPLQKDSIGGYTSLPIATTRSQLPTFYRIVRRAPSLNFTTSPPTKDLVVFNTKADIELFWKNTEITYERMEKNPCVPADLLFLTRKRLWHYKRSYTNAQISSLNSWIDPKSKTTPISNDEVCKALAEELNLSLKAVKHFYSNYEFYERSAGERRRRKRKSRWRDDTSDDSDDSLEDYEDFNIYRGEHSGSEEDEFMERRSNPFSPDDDILLCIAAVVLEHFKGSKKPLHVLTQIFPLRNISKVAYRRRITYLRNKSGPKDIINTLSVFWPEFISDAKSQQNWLSGINDVLLSSNFLGVVYAFRKFVSLKDPYYLFDVVHFCRLMNYLCQS